MFRVELTLCGILAQCERPRRLGLTPFGEYLARKARPPCKWSGIGTLVLCARGSQLLAGPHCAPVRSSPLQLAIDKEAPSCMKTFLPNTSARFALPPSLKPFSTGIDTK